MTPTMPGARVSHAPAADHDAPSSARRATSKGDDNAPRFADELERSLPTTRQRPDAHTGGPKRRKGRAGEHDLEAPTGLETSKQNQPHPVLRHVDAKRHAAEPAPAPNARIEAPELTRDSASVASRRDEHPHSTNTHRADDAPPLDAAASATQDLVRPVPTDQRPAGLDASAAAPVDGARATGAADGMARVAAADDVGVLLAVHSARVVIDTGAEGPLTVVVRVRDGAADVRALGPAAQALATGEISLRRSLGEHGLDLSNFSAHDERGSWSGQDGRRELEEHRELFTKTRATTAPAAERSTVPRRGLRA